MSVLVKSSTYTKNQLENIREDMLIKLEKGPTSSVYIEPFCTSGQYHVIPFAYGRQKLNIEPPLRNKYPSMKNPFIGDLRPEQQKFKKDVGTVLATTGSAVASAYVGFGKTVVAISLACTVKLKTLIVINKLMLFDQWIESVTKFVGNDPIIQKLKPDTPLDPDAQFYIVNAQNIPKFPHSELKKIGFVIVDEAHLIVAETLYMSLNHLFPRYILALTATPYRPDGLTKLLDFFFGQKQIVVKMWRPFTFHKIWTGVKIDHPGKEWNKVLGAQANSHERNELITNLVMNNPDRNILIMVKRVNHGDVLYRLIKDAMIENGHVKPSITKLLRNNQTFDKDARVLVGTTQKMGTGFDHPRMDTLILASDIKEFFIQYLGRIFRRKNSNPVVFDLVDDHGILQYHYKERAKVYKEHGGKLKPYYIYDDSGQISDTNSDSNSDASDKDEKLKIIKRLF